MTGSQELLATLSPMDFNRRIVKARESLPENMDALYLTHLTNIRYLTGFTGSNAALYLTRNSLTFFTDGRYTTQSHEQISAAGVNADIKVSGPGQSFFDFLTDLIEVGTHIGFEADTLSYAGASRLIEHFDEATFEPTSNFIEDIRIIKDAGEVDRIRAACRIADEALEEVKEYLKEFPTEKDFAKALDRKMVDLGAEGNSFETIVACGTRAALPHAVPTDAKIEPHQMIVIDFGCMVDGYCSDMTRTLSVGEPDADQQKMYAQVLESQRLGREYAKSGVTAGEVDAKCRDFLNSEGVGEYFAHGTGHGVGLDIHEAPRVGGKVQDILQTGYIVTVEPGIYIEGKAGVRIEDTLCITEEGAEVLTTAPKELVV